MTPKEKANKIRYQLESAMQDADMRGYYNQATKQCALIAVDLILIDCGAKDWSGDAACDGKNYWHEVKQEIEKL